MNILLLGSGGREHALAWKMAQSKLCTALFIAPGNPGTAQCGTNVKLSPIDFPAIAEFIEKNSIEMVVVGPEEPLVKGVVDFLRNDERTKDMILIGPSQAGAQLEGSKDFSKIFMEKYGVPTARYTTVDASTIQEAYAFLDTLKAPYVLKADGLAAGKGVLILDDINEAKAELKSMLDGKFGQASTKVVIEEFLKGIELSVFVLTDGKSYLILPEAKDYKRIGEGDTGLNTGGMGAVSPVPFADAEFLRKVDERVAKPTVDGLRKEGIDYKGFIFIGLMNVDGEPLVIEYNCRMGDPETEVVIPRLKSDLVELFVAVGKQELDKHKIAIDPATAITVMAVAGGYPGDYKKGDAISGVDSVNETTIFHAGTALKDGELQTNGGRVMAFTSIGETIEGALAKSYGSLSKVSYEGIYYRRDIGKDLQ